MLQIIELIISKWLFGLVVLVLLTLLFHYLFVWRKNLSKRQWKKVDYWWVALAFMGVITAISKVDLRFVDHEIEDLTNRLPGQYQSIHTRLAPPNLANLCKESVKREFPPADYDSIVADYKKSCLWATTAFYILSAIDTNNYSTFPTSKLPPVTVNNKVILFTMNELRKDIVVYNVMVATLEKDKKLKKDSSEDLATYFAPLFLIAGLALRITKTSGELKYEPKA